MGLSDILNSLTHSGTEKSWSISLSCVLASTTTRCIEYSLQYGAPLDSTRYFEPTVLWYSSLCFRFISFSRASRQLPTFCSVCNTPGNTSTLNDVTSSWARSRRSVPMTHSSWPYCRTLRRSSDSFPLLHDNPVNSISFLSDILNLPYNLANWRCCSLNVFKQWPFPHTRPSLPQLEARQEPSSSNRLESSPRTVPWVVCHPALLFLEPIKDHS